MPKTNKELQNEPALNEVNAKKAFETFQPRMAKLTKEQIVSPNTSVDAAAIVAISVAHEANAAPLRARFEALPKSEFDVTSLDDLEPLARASWYVFTQFLSVNATGSEAKLPAELVDEATAQRARMIKVCEYHFEPTSKVGKQIADIKLGTGYRDLAVDLTRLAKIFRQEEAELRDDKKHYRKGDAARAEKLSQRILGELGAAKSAEQKHWSDMLARSWTLLLRAYDEVASTGNWLLRKEGGDRFPSLVTAGRAARAKARKSEDAEGDEPAPAPGGSASEGEK